MFILGLRLPGWIDLIHWVLFLRLFLSEILPARKGKKKRKKGKEKQIRKNRVHVLQNWFGKMKSREEEKERKKEQRKRKEIEYQDTKYTFRRKHTISR